MRTGTSFPAWCVASATINAYAGQRVIARPCDGYLHGPFVLNEVQKSCGFAKGECVQIFIDSCPILDSKYRWFIKDATDAFGEVASGEGDVKQLQESQPY